ncbi:AbrB family transcriptional regulator [Cellvibrio sp. KY-GH-1]|uniref:AbrB family transcriptional regulator n=1 Tax=Cellvibrio sp. KY-GH-1 TaxID=2303332 RepID=UPI001243EB43|nr:AbrB family transcriptional regulator [Cellvibrio sp. KY-GH-1]QEY18252.1 AbrB family transcriptional regulator [Cellvibrio sp. KY-GH-1]
MRTITIETDGKDQIICLPKDMEYKDIHELEIFKDGDTLILRPARPSWTSLADQPKADPNWLIER